MADFGDEAAAMLVNKGGELLKSLLERMKRGEYQRHAGIDGSPHDATRMNAQGNPVNQFQQQAFCSFPVQTTSERDFIVSQMRQAGVNVNGTMHFGPTVTLPEAEMGRAQNSLEKNINDMNINNQSDGFATHGENIIGQNRASQGRASRGSMGENLEKTGKEMRDSSKQLTKSKTASDRVKEKIAPKTSTR